MRRSAPDHHGLPGSKWSCLLLRIVLQDASSEVTKIDPPLKLRVFVNDITALVMRKNEEVAEVAQKVMKRQREEVERKGFELSVKQNGTEGKSKMIASCGFLVDELRQCSKEEGVTVADRVETLERKSAQRRQERGAHAVGLVPTERLKLRREMAGAAGKKSTTSLSFLMEAYGLEWTEGAWNGKWHHEQKEAWMKQVREVQMWRQVRRLAGAVMCETRDLGIKWTHRHTLKFEGDRKIDMRYVCPKDVKKMLLQQARTVYWKKWAAKHEYE